QLSSLRTANTVGDAVVGLALGRLSCAAAVSRLQRFPDDVRGVRTGSGKPARRLRATAAFRCGLRNPAEHGVEQLVQRAFDNTELVEMAHGVDQVIDVRATFATGMGNHLRQRVEVQSAGVMRMSSIDD